MPMVGKEEAKQFKHTITLRFRSEEDKQEFIGGFLDGWGEGAPLMVSCAVPPEGEKHSWDQMFVEPLEDWF